MRKPNKQRLVITVDFEMDDEDLDLRMEGRLEEEIREVVEDDHGGFVTFVEFRGERP